MSLICVLLVASLLVVLAFTVASMSITHLNISNRLDLARVAELLAENAANQAIQSCIYDPDWGTTGNAGQNTEIKLSSAPGGWGRVTFDFVRSATYWGMPRSLNNLNGQSARRGYKRTVSPHTLQVVAYGHYGGVTRAVEAIIGTPAYKYAVASAGPIQSSGGLLVADIADPSQVARGLVSRDLLRPGFAFSNNADPSAVQLDSSREAAQASRITGDLQAVGGIGTWSGYTRVDGSILSGASPERIPMVVADDYDPGRGESVRTLDQSWYKSLEVTGASRRRGDLSVGAGVLLDNGLLYVDGNLEVYGGLRGQGVVVSTGAVKIRGMHAFEAAESQVIIARGSVAIEGVAKDVSAYQGVIYSGRDFQARDLTIVGGVLVGGGATLASLNLLHSTQAMNVSYRIRGPRHEHEGSGGAQLLNFNPSRFLLGPDRYRKILWHEIPVDPGWRRGR